ncbi:metallophosphoesterase [Paenibacillus sp. S150]|uniref:metallophosphoesterase n=1 Tax=Paenibacillus sp. S150 TaxID=2749826 RepID=UPI001C59E38B|nr:metallophosphoesterase [Paenibacillus sp. S150]MBW4082861.1 metallophosphoesterase family protein [Paenibacillus sp. S150]
MVTAWLLGMLAFCLLLLVWFGTAMLAAAFRDRIIAEEIFLEALPGAFDGFRILFISDIHRRRLPGKLLKSLKGKVDAVFLGGDMTERGGSMNRLHDNMTLTAELAPVYAVHGNHDYRANTALVDNIIRGSGVRLLQDESIIIEKNESRLLLTGVDFPRSGGKKAYRPLPPLTGAESSLCRIILVHDPLWLSRQPEVPADLVLAGHTHGGQVVLPFVGHRHVDPFYREYNAGRYVLPGRNGAEAQMLISRGFGTAHLPLRWGSPAEMHVLTLRRGSGPAAGGEQE